MGDWIDLVALDIRKEFPLTTDSLREIINRHCPFKAYEPIKTLSCPYCTSVIEDLKALLKINIYLGTMSGRMLEGQQVINDPHPPNSKDGCLR